MITRAMSVMMGLVLVAGLTACSDYKDSGGQTVEQRDSIMIRQAQNTVAQFKAEYPHYSKFFDTAAGYAAFPTVTQGAFIIGGAHSDGVLMENGKATGFLDMYKGSVGLQLEGQQYSQIIFYQDAKALGDLKRGEAEALAEASAVIADKDASASADYEGGVAVFLFGGEGAGLKAAVGGQKFKFRAK